MSSPSPDPFLTDLLSVAGPVFYETPAAERWREEARRRGLTVHGDALGNSFAHGTPEAGRPDLALFGHIDEIGLVVTDIKDNGLLLFRGVGWDPQVLVGQRVRIRTGDGELIGVIGRKPVHLLEEKDKATAVKIADLWIDIGARSGDEARAAVAIGDPAVIDAQPVSLRNGLIASKSLDDRIGAYVALEVAARLREQGRTDVAAVATVQEETSYAGAYTAAEALRPRVGIAIDICIATDVYDDPALRGEGPHTLGRGPVVYRGSGSNARVVELLLGLADEHEIPLQLHASFRATGTDGETVQRTGGGIPTGVVAIPCRYAHSPVETLALSDVEHAIALLVAFGAALDGTQEFDL